MQDDLQRARSGGPAVIGATAYVLFGAGSVTIALFALGIVPMRSGHEFWRIGALGDLAGTFVIGMPLWALNRTDTGTFLQPKNWPLAIAIAAVAALSATLVHLNANTLTGLLAPLAFLPHLLIGVLTARFGLVVGAAAVPTALVGAYVAAHWSDGATANGALVGATMRWWADALTLAALPLLVTAVLRRLNARQIALNRALEASGLGFAELDLRGARVHFSPRWLEMLGYKFQSFGNRLDSFWERIHPDDLAAVQAAFAPLRTPAPGNCHCACRMLTQDGRWLPVEVNAVLTARSFLGEPSKAVCTARDASDDLAHRGYRALCEGVFQHLHEGLLITDAKLRVVSTNPKYTEIIGHSEQESLGTVPAILRVTDPEAVDSVQPLSMRAGLETSGTWEGEIVSRRSNGEPCTLLVSANAVRNQSGAVQNHVLAFTDITQIRQQIEQLRRQAHFDELTGLPNRVKLTQILMEVLASTEREGSLLTVCFLDLDYFKPINDQFGHHVGDQLLIKLAERLSRALRTRASGDDVIARIGGDEFVLLLRTATIEESQQAVERMLRQVHQPFALEVSEAPIFITASIGATVYPLDQADAETLLRHADHAMYGAKQAGRNGYQFFDAEHDRRTEARFVALGRVQEALDAQEFCLYFQPKVDMRDGHVIGVEALLRWNHPEQGLLLPAQFLPLIEHTGLAVSVGNWVLQRGIEQLAQWQAMGLDLTVSINVSARHLQEPTFARHLTMLLAEQNTPVADRLVLEILETTALADMDYTCDLMQECRALGVRFALDDFGTGYSTLTYLKRLPLDMLKIDRSFVINMLNDRHDLAIVEGVIGLSETFGCSVVAEGVDTLEQAQRLIEIGCDIGQGNGIAPAMPADEVVDWVHSFSGISTLAAPLFD